MADFAALVPLPASVPVEMPALPPLIAITTPAQMKALGDAARTNITHAIQHQPLTAKQIAARLGMTPGTVGHHLHVLERAGLVQIVALRMIRGTVAKYYTRTARMYAFAPNDATNAAPPVEMDMVTSCRDELAETLAHADPATICLSFFPHALISRARVSYFYERIDALIQEFLAEPPNAEGQVMSFGAFLFTAPPALQPQAPHPDAAKTPDADLPRT